MTTTRGDPDRAFPLASVTKLLTATAVLVAVQEEVVALDEPAGPPGATVRHLLAHASGLPFEGDTPIAAPAQRRVYGNRAYELLGDLVAERAGMPFVDYLRDGVCVPLDLYSTTVEGSPAHGGTSTVADLLRFAAELQSPGRILAPDLLAEATHPQWPDLAGVLPGYGRQSPNSWGLGFELHDHKHPHWMPEEAAASAYGHFGQSGSFLWVDPEAGMAAVALADEPFGDWAIDAWPALGADILRAAAVR